jgi:hypothetical protein
MGYSAAGRSTPELLKDWSAVMRELRKRDVIRTNNNPVGDIAEAIVAAHYEGERGAFAQRGWDVRLQPSAEFPEGERVQVKAMRRTPANRRSSLSPIRDADYDTVVIVIFDEDYNVTEGLRLTRAIVETLFVHKAYINGRVITVTRALRADPRVAAVDLAHAAQRLHA